MHFRGTNTVKTLPMAPKDKDHKLQKIGIIYNYKCQHTNCTEQYIGESGKTLTDRVKEHLRASSPIHQHSSTTGHRIMPDCFNIIHRESKKPQGTSKRPCYKGQWSFTKWEHWKIPVTTHLGPNTTGHSNTKAQVTSKYFTQPSHTPLALPPLSNHHPCSRG